MKSTAAMALTIARFTLLETVRGRVIIMMAGVVAAAMLVALFLRLVAITEVDEIQASIIAALERLCAVFLLTSIVVTGIRREFDDGVVTLILAHPLRRASYVLGKSLGYGALAAIFALVFAAPLLAFAAPLRVALWTSSLAAELVLVACAAVFCAISLRTVTAAFAAVAGFYALGRSIDAMLVIASASPGARDWRSVGARWITEAIGVIVPHIDRMTESAWLIAPSLENRAVGIPMLEAAVYALLLLAASLFDFERQNF